MSLFLTEAKARFSVLRGELNALDAVIGDGDHGDAICNGLAAASDHPSSPELAFRHAAGGATGPLFGVLLHYLLQVADREITLARALSNAEYSIKILGNANPGDKTMLDALIPAIEAAQKDDGSRIVAEAARVGAESTRDMEAKRGRARAAENAGKGHIDAGAVSVAELLHVLAGII